VVVNNNTAISIRYGSTIGGGISNTASNTNSTIGGGECNTASGTYSTVGGGYVIQHQVIIQQ
jgi:hypothetical protein